MSGKPERPKSEQNARDSLLALQARSEPDRRADEASWIGVLREQGRIAFGDQGIPTRRLEAWKGTSLAPLEAMSFDRIGSASRTSIRVPEDTSAGSGNELVFVDGRFEPEASRIDGLPRGCRLLSLAEARRSAPELLEGRLGKLADPKRHALVALQTAFLDDGVVLVIDRNVSVPAPIQLRFLTSGGSGGDGESCTAVFSRLLVVMGEHARATLCHTHDTLGPASAPGLSACVGEIELARGARLETIQIQDEAASRIHFTSLHARLERDARFDSHVFTLGEGLTRSELEVTLAEPGGDARMRGFFLGRASGHVDHFTTVDHAADHCTSDEEYRGVLGDRSRGVFRGRVIVRPDSQKTDARQSNPNLLISDHATIDSKPQLEIYADDVRASHGSTIGQLDPDALFFLRARGIDTSEARLMLTRSFAYAIVEGIEEVSVRALAAERVDRALAGLESAALQIGGNAGTGPRAGTDREIRR